MGHKKSAYEEELARFRARKARENAVASELARLVSTPSGEDGLCENQGAPLTPFEDALDRLSFLMALSVACGYKGCESVVFGPTPGPGPILESGLTERQEFEQLLNSHFEKAGHKRHKYRHLLDDGRCYEDLAKIAEKNVDNNAQK